VILAVVTPDSSATDEPAWAAIFITVLLLSYATVGAFIASRRPGNPIGWIFCGAGLFLAGFFLAVTYTGYALYFGTSPVLGAQYFAWLSDQLSLSVVPLTMILLLLLFPSGKLPTSLLLPDGRLPFPGWQAVVCMAVGGSVMLGLWQITGPGIGTDDPNYVGNPLEIDGPIGNVVEVGGKIGAYLLVVSTLFAGASLISRVDLATGEERQQLKWFAYGAVMMIGGFLGAFALGVSELAWTIGFFVGFLGFGSFPIATGFAILKYRLYDIDVVINRTLVYGLLTILLAAGYVATIMALQEIGTLVFQVPFRAVFGQKSTLATIAATLAMAALFNPLRRRIQSFIDRSFYRNKYDAAKTLEEFSMKLRDETDLNALSDDLVRVVRETMQPAHVSVWLHSDPALKDKKKKATI
jgi:hypothetical protein